MLVWLNKKFGLVTWKEQHLKSPCIFKKNYSPAEDAEMQDFSSKAYYSSQSLSSILLEY